MVDILYVEDDAIIASGLIYALQAEGYEVTHCASVKAALAALADKEYAMALLDVSLPDGSGFDVCRKIREKGDVPIIFLTALDDEGSTVMGLEIGADDYITKPFRVRELLARVKTVLRRYDTTAPTDLLTLGDLRIHTQSAKVWRGDTELILSALEYRLLLTLVSRKGQVLTRGQILEYLWDEAGNFVNDNTLTVYVKRLREKIGDDPHEPVIIQTVRGIGYRAG